MLQNDLSILGRCCGSWFPSSWPVIDRVCLVIPSRQVWNCWLWAPVDGEPQYAAQVQPPTCRLHKGAALLTDVAYCFFFCDFLYCFYSSLQFNSWNHSISSVQSTVSLIRWLSAYASVIVTQACHSQGWMIEWLKRNQKHFVNVHHLYTFFSKINVL